MTRTLWLINGLAVTVPARLIDAIDEWPGVDRIDLDRVVTQSEMQVISAPHSPRVTPSSTTTASEWNIDTVGAPALWSLGFSGAGLVVASMDSGVDANHQDLAGRWRGAPNGWFDPNGEHATPHDATGHGTQAMGIILGGNGGGSAIGVAPGAAWIGVKIFDDSGTATFSGIHAGFQWVLDPDDDPDTDDAADIVNNSWGLRDQVGECIDEFRDDVMALRAAGIAVVFSAGNEGPLPSTSLSPGNDPDFLAVGATDIAELIGPFSSRGPSACASSVFPSITAPGVDIRSADLTFGGIFPASYTWVDGTSFAAPHVSGGMALLAEAFPAATVAQLEWAVQASARDRGPSGPDDDYGYGILDLVEALNLLAAGGICGVDDDGDGHFTDGGICGEIDCDDSDAAIWGAPAEARALTMQADRESITWSAPLEAGGDLSQLRYDTVRSTQADDFVSADCVEANEGPDTGALDEEVPGAGVVFYYLVRSENDCSAGPGTLGPGSDGLERPGTACP